MRGSNGSLTFLSVPCDTMHEGVNCNGHHDRKTEETGVSILVEINGTTEDVVSVQVRRGCHVPDVRPVLVGRPEGSMLHQSLWH